jgi:putative hydrolase of the HAD superfamily
MLTVTLDLDDTLWPIDPVIEAAESALLAWFGEHAPRVLERIDRGALRRLRADEERRAPELSHDLTELRLRSIRSALLLSGYPADLAEAAFLAFMEARNRVALFDDVSGALETLSAHCRLGAISNGNADLQAIGLARFFDFHVTARATGAMKPDSRIFDEAIRLAGVSRERIVHVGDDIERDVLGASAAGMRAIWLDRKGDGEVPPEAEARISNLRELMPLLVG